MTRPIIPVGANGISFSSLANAPNTLMTDFSTKLERTSDENLRKWLNPPLEPETKGTSETEFTDEKAKAYFSTGGSTFEKSFGTKYSDPSSSL